MSHAAIDPTLPNVRVIVNNGVRIEGAGGTPVVYVDPYLIEGEPRDADLVLVTHEHHDHLSPDDVARVSREGAVLVGPAAMAERVGAVPVGETYLVAPGETLEVAGVAVEAVPAYNTHPDRAHCHPREYGGLGYVIALDGVRYYVAGDTDPNEDVERVVCDVALVPVGGTYTMDVGQAAAFVNGLRPAVAVPTHYGCVAGTPDDGEAFAALVDDGIAVAVKLERFR